MSGFIAAAFGFPTVLFSFLLVVVAGYWLFVLAGVATTDALDPTGDGDGPEGSTGLLAGLGLGGVPVTVVLSALVTVAWFVSLAGTVLVDAAGPVGPLAGLAVLAVAAASAWLVTRALVLALRRLLPKPGPAASRTDFVGRTCVVRTLRVGPDFGQAEVTADDGSTAIVQVRADDRSARELAAGSTALIYDFDADGEFFWVTPADVTP